MTINDRKERDQVIRKLQKNLMTTTSREVADVLRARIEDLESWTCTNEGGS